MKDLCLASTYIHIRTHMYIQYVHACTCVCEQWVKKHYEHTAHTYLFLMTIPPEITVIIHKTAVITTNTAAIAIAKYKYHKDEVSVLLVVLVVGLGVVVAGNTPK